MAEKKESSERSYLLEVERLCRLFVNYKTDGEVESFKQMIVLTLKKIDDARAYAQRAKEARRRK